MTRQVQHALLYVAVVLILIWTLAPYVWLILSSVSYKIDLLTVPLHWIPKRITLRNYETLFFDKGSTTANAS